MFQRFFTDTAESRFIKALLYNTPLPLYSTVRDGDYIIKDCYYAWSSYIIKCLSSGYIGKTPEGTSGTASYEVVQNYLFGKNYPKFTERFLSNYHYYDSLTHRYFIKFLRCLRDLRGINLLPFCNCFCGEYNSSYYLISSEIALGNTGKYKIAQVPIKFNTTYTIALDCPTDVLMMPAMLSNDNLLKVIYKGNQVDLTGELEVKEPIRYSMLSYKLPKTFRINSDSSLLQTYEKYLTLLIQLPATATSSITVLEGDYTNQSTDSVANISELSKMTNAELDALCLSPLSLLQLNDKITYAFNDKIIEYLLLNVITVDDSIYDNIERAQKFVNLYSEEDVAWGVWNTLTRITLYQTYMQNKNTSKIDVNGFVDRNMETFFTRKVKL